MRLHPVLLTCLAVAIPAAGFGQDYILRPGPRGFDPSLNRYGTTENAPAAADDGFDPSRTTVKIELLQEGTGGGLAAQEWNRKLADLGYSVRIRQPILSDKAEVTEATRGTLRFVTVVGKLDRRGNLVFPGRTFTPGEAARLGEWLDELKTYGAQGTPHGQPLWGLNKPQFEAIYAALSKRVSADVTDLPLRDAIAKLPLPNDYPVRFGAEAKRTAAEAGRPESVSRSVAGLSAGTALAFVLNEFGLGFRPERTPKGTIELLVEPLPAPTKPAPGDGPPTLVVWPVGWDIEEPTAPVGDRPVKDGEAIPPNRVQLAPTLFEFEKEEIGLRDAPLIQALSAAEEATGVPILLDRAGVDAVGLELDEARVTAPPRRTSWNIVLRSITFRHRLRHDLRRDEAGHPLVWVTPLRAGR